MKKKILKLLGALLIIILSLSIVLFIRIQLFSTPTSGKKILTYENPRDALLVIDIQQDFTGEKAKPPFPYKNSDLFITNVNNVIENAERKNTLVVYIKQIFNNNLLDWPLTKGRVLKEKAGSQIDSRVKLLNSNIFEKERSDAFSKENQVRNQ